jgi:hypothetical protein
MPGARFTTTAHAATATTDKIPALKSTTKGYLTPQFFWPPGHLYGLTLANNGSDATNDIDVAAGSCMDSTGVAPMILTALTKRLDANWAAGTNQGMRNSAAAITDTTYHIYAVCKAGGADPDIYAHASATVATVITALQAETGGSAYLYARRIGSIIRASAAIVAFSQNGDEFLRSAIASDLAAGSLGTTAVLQALSVPLGIKVKALVSATLTDGSPAGDTHVLLTSPDQTDVAASLTNCSLRVSSNAAGATAVANSASFEIRTDTSAQIRYRLDASQADIGLFINTRGWIDTRGRLA